MHISVSCKVPFLGRQCLPKHGSGARSSEQSAPRFLGRSSSTVQLAIELAESLGIPEFHFQKLQWNIPVSAAESLQGIRRPELARPVDAHTETHFRFAADRVPSARRFQHRPGASISATRGVCDLECVAPLTGSRRSLGWQGVFSPSSVEVPALSVSCRSGCRTQVATALLQRGWPRV